MTLYRGFDQETLESEYSPSAHVDDLDAYIARYARDSAEARASLTCRAGLAYGPSAEETLDLFPAAEPGAPVQVFIHGGYWQMLSKDESSGPAPDFVRRGAAYAALNYALAPEVTLDEIVRQNRAAVAWLYKNGADHGIDPERIHVTGHSAGGHLAAMLLATDWERDFGVPADVIKGASAVSGIYDLEPICQIPVNDALNMTAEDAARNSPILHIPAPGHGGGCPLVVSSGGRETAEFQRQSAAYAEAWRTAGHPCTVADMPDHNHFDIIFELGNGETPLGRAVLGQMGLDTA